MDTEHLKPAVLEWFANGETGVSSKTIACTIVGIHCEDIDHPYDPDDFRRCYLLLQRIPELKEHLDKLREISDTWDRLIDRWDEVEASFLREWDYGRGKRAPDTYRLMKEIQGD